MGSRTSSSRAELYWHCYSYCIDAGDDPWDLEVDPGHDDEERLRIWYAVGEMRQLESPDRRTFVNAFERLSARDLQRLLDSRQSGLPTRSGLLGRRGPREAPLYDATYARDGDSFARLMTAWAAEMGELKRKVDAVYDGVGRPSY